MALLADSEEFRTHPDRYIEDDDARRAVLTWKGRPPLFVAVRFRAPSHRRTAVCVCVGALQTCSCLSWWRTVMCAASSARCWM